MTRYYNDYLIHSDDTLTHYGVLGMKWGVRRYQNKDGSLTNAGKKRYDENVLTAKNKLQTAKKQAAMYKVAYTYHPFNTNMAREYDKSNLKVNYAKENLKNEKVKSILRNEKSKSKRRIELENKYKSKGMSSEDAAVAAYKRERTEKAIMAAGAVTLAAAGAYLAYKHYDKTVDKIIKSGTKIQNISNDANKGVSDPFYFSKNAMDKIKYKGLFGKAMSANGKVYNTEITVNKNIKVASEKSATNALSELVKNDKTFASNLRKHLEETNLELLFRPKEHKVVSNAISKLDSGKVDSDVYNALNMALANHNTSTASSVSKSFYDKLKSKGYDAVQDVNDKKYSGYKSKNPIIGFNLGDKSAVTKVSELGDKEIQKNANIAWADIMAVPLAATIGGYAAYYKTVMNASTKLRRKHIEKGVITRYRNEHPKSKLSDKQIIDSYYNY